MRINAFILICCTLVYLVELAAMPRLMMAPAPKTCCAQMEKTTACTHCPNPDDKSSDDKSSDDKSSDDKSGKGCSPMADCCLNCPLCYVAVLPSSGEPPVTTAITRIYSGYRSSYHYLYQSSAWKPPNRA